MTRPPARRLGAALRRPKALHRLAAVIGVGLLVFVAPGVAGSATTVLVGDQTVEAHADSNGSGAAEAFSATATATGSANQLSVYLGTGTTATSVTIGLYSAAGGHPANLLTSGTITSPTPNAWNTVSTPAAAVTSGTSYWIALLGQNGPVFFRDRCCGGGGTGPAETAAQTSLTSLPATWTTGKAYHDGPASAYFSNAGGAPALSVNPTSLALTAVAGTRLPVTGTLTIANTGGGSLSWAASTANSWLQVSPASGTGNGSVDVTALVQGQPAGTQTGAVTITAPGAGGSPVTVPVTLTLLADNSPPVVTLTAPSGGATVSGSTTVSATAYDDTAVADVQFQLDGQNLGADQTTAPYLVSWDTTAAPNGSHTLTAIARDSVGNTTTSSPVTVTVANSSTPPTVLDGDQVVEPKSDSNATGVAEAFQTTATASGTAAKLSVYVDAGSAAGTLVAGIYANASGHPGALLGSGSLASPRAAAWNDVPLSGSPQLTSGATYWLAILGTGGTLRYRDRCCSGGSASETASSRTLTNLPATWSTGTSFRDGPLSAYVTSTGQGSTTPVLSVVPQTLDFSAQVGGANPAPAPLAITNTGAGTLTYSATSDAPWLSVAPASGSAPQTAQVSVDAGSLAVGSYTGHITVSAAGATGSPATVTVTLGVTQSSGGGGSSHDWLMVDHDPARTGDATGETVLGTAAAKTLGLAWTTHLDGKVTAQPLYVGGVQVNGQTHDVVVGATAANSVYALDADTGAVLWRDNLGSESGNCAIPGGFGVTGAPVIDRARNRVFAMADNGQLHTISLSTGSDLTAALPVIAGPSTNKMWGGLNLVGNSLYIADASDGCDTPPWMGEVYKVDVSGASPTLAGSWIVVPGTSGNNRGGGIWGYGGVSVDTGTGTVFAAPGADQNELYTPYADRLVALDAGLNVLGTYEPFHPTSFPCNGSPCDVDFGATPVVYQPSGCPTMVAVGNKNGNLYVTKASDLIASAPPLQILTLNPANDWLGNGGVGGVPSYWPQGRMLFVTDAGSGVAGINAGIVGLTINPDCTLSVAWSAQIGGDGDPNSTPTVADGVVYVGAGNDGRVFAFDAATGTQLWNSGSTAQGSTFAAPTVANGMLFVGSWDGQSSANAGTIRAYAPGATPSSVLVGDQNVEGASDSDPNGQAEAFQTTATDSGTLGSLTLYLDAGSTSTKVVAGIYASSGAHPGTLLAQGSSTTLTPGSWNAIPLPSGAAVTAGTTYWIAIGSVGTGQFRFRDRYAGPCKAETSSQTTLTALPSTWTTGKVYTDCPLSAYGSTPP
jgi:outer membrane protein assembly factor BamB